MELVYLWVEEYKNIKNQGFNFSPRFTCKYDEASKELTIYKKEHVSIFPDNINVTAIVGENGSGKSSILEIAKLILEDKGKEHKRFLIWKSNECFYYKGNVDKIKPANEIKIEENKNINFFTHSSDVFNTLLWMNQKNKLYDCGDDMQFNSFKNQNPNDFRTSDLSLNMPVYFAYSQNQVLYYLLKSKKRNKIFNPIKYELTLIGTYFVRKLSAILSYWESESEKSLEKIKEEMQSYVQKITDSPNIKIINRLYLFLEKLESNSDEKAFGLSPFITKGKIPSYKEMENLLSTTYDDEDFSSTFKLLDKLDLENVNLLEDDKDDLLQILENDLSKNIFVDVYKMMLYELIKDTYRTYDDLSAGEKDSLLLIALLYNYFEKKQKQDCLILLDEIEAFYHPNWTRELFNVLFDELKDKEVQLVVTSHSPFILSDLPKENVIFLENGKQVYPNIETFGANIHTLLSHGFFMKDGLMGEFAKEKINDAIKYLNKKSLSKKEIDYCENIISIIGEPILKNQLQRMLNSKRLSKVDKIDKLEEELELIKHRIEMIRKNQ